MFRTLGGTGISLSVVGFGCWAIGGQHWGTVDDETSIRAVHAALDAGINWFDTAPLYGSGHADEVLVRAIRAAGKEAFIATKVGVVDPGPSGHAESWLTPDRIRADIEASLSRLGLPHLDLVQVHWPCQHGTPLRETFGALDDLVREGKIRFVGVCNYGGSAIAEIAQYMPIRAVQTPYSMLRREFELDVGPTAERLGIDVLVYEPLCRGLLTGKFRSLPSFPETDLRRHDERFQGGRFARATRLVEDLRRVADRLGVPVAAVAMGWALNKPGVRFAIAGMKTPEQVRENVAAAKLVGKGNIQAVLDRVLAMHPPA